MTGPTVDEGALTAAHLAVENELVELRDAGFGLVGYGNGLVIHHRDGAESTVMRLGTREALRIGVRAYLAALPQSDHDRIIALVRARAEEPREGQRPSHQNLMAAVQLLTEAVQQEQTAGNGQCASDVNRLVLAVFAIALRADDPISEGTPS